MSGEAEYIGDAPDGKALLRDPATGAVEAVPKDEVEIVERTPSMAEVGALKGEIAELRGVVAELTKAPKPVTPTDYEPRRLKIEIEKVATERIKAEAAKEESTARVKLMAREEEAIAARRAEEAAEAQRRAEESARRAELDKAAGFAVSQIVEAVKGNSQATGQTLAQISEYVTKTFQTQNAEITDLRKQVATLMAGQSALIAGQANIADSHASARVETRAAFSEFMEGIKLMANRPEPVIPQPAPRPSRFSIVKDGDGKWNVEAS